MATIKLLASKGLLSFMYIRLSSAPLHINTCLNLSHDRFHVLFVRCTHMLTVVYVLLGSLQIRNLRRLYYFKEVLLQHFDKSRAALTSVPFDDYDDLEFITGILLNCQRNQASGTGKFLAFFFSNKLQYTSSFNTLKGNCVWILVKSYFAIKRMVLSSASHFQTPIGTWLLL